MPASFLLALLLIAVPAASQVTVAIVAPGATDANVAAARVAALTLPAVPCGVAKAPEQAQPIVNPTEARYDDPANAARDCVVMIEPAISSLPAASGYLAALKLNAERYGPLSTAFARQIPGGTTHPCAGTAPTAGTVLEGARLLSWCWNGLDANSVATTVTSWNVYVDGVKSVLANVTVGTVVDTDGERLYTAPLVVVRGTRIIQVTGVNAAGEATTRPSFTLTVQAPAALPSGATIRGVQ